MQRQTEPGLLSVVVPAHDVEAYLQECLASILDQSYQHLEVVLVDDGSTDATGRIADEVAARDPRVRVLHQDNVGLGATRNIGAHRARGEYLAFADSDDLVPPQAYERLVASLRRSGSDLATGMAQRFDGETTYFTPLMREHHDRHRERTTVDEHPLLLADVFAWNKVFRRSFWDSARLGFPGGVRYEDQPAITRALLSAEAIDVLPDLVYGWRVRADGSSLSQRRAEVADLEDRWRTKRMATETVLARSCLHTQGVWFARVLPIDMWEYFRSVPGCSEEYWSVLREGMAELWGLHTVPFERTRLPLRQRVMGWLVAADRREELVEFLDWLDQLDGPLPRREVGGAPVADHPFASVRDLPPELVRP